MRFAKRLATLMLAGLPATALTLGVSAPAAHAQEAPQLTWTVDRTFSVLPEVRLPAGGRGDVRITGTYTCTNVNLISMFGSIEQSIRRKSTVSGIFDYTAPSSDHPAPRCDGRAHTWRTGLRGVEPQRGRFTDGTATIFPAAAPSEIDYCGGAVCGRTIPVQQTVRLRVRD